MTILVLDVGGNNVKIGLQGREGTVARVPSGPTLRPDAMVEGVRKATEGIAFDRITIGLPGPIRKGKLVAEPVNLGGGWTEFDFAGAFQQPTKLINDAAMQALGSYEGGKMLFLGLGTGLGAAMVVEGTVLGLELAHLPYKRNMTFEDYAGTRGLKRLGKKPWQRAVQDVIARLRAAMVADEVVLGGGNAKRLEQMPTGCRMGDNSRAIVGGLRLWDEGMRVI